MPAAPLRSLADDLRGRGDDQLAALLLARPDLVHPVPADIAALAQRAGSPPSVSAALRAHDELALHVVLAAALESDPMTPTDLVRAVAPHLPSQVPAKEARERVRAAVDRLRLEALLWGPDRALHLVGAARDLMVPADRGPRVAALDPVVAGYCQEPAALEALVATAPDGARAALDRLLAGSVVGIVADARRAADPERSPVDWLLAHHLLVALGADRAIVPAEVAAILRGRADPSGRPELAVATLSPPLPAEPGPGPARTESGAVGAVLDVLHAVAELGILWIDAPPTRLRTGGIALREVARTARALGLSEPVTCLVIEVAGAAGLVAADSGMEAMVLPTPLFDVWLNQAPAAQHADLLLAWRDMPRTVARPPVRPLAPELAAPHIPGIRCEVLAAMSTADGAWTPDELVQAMAWQAPRRHEPGRYATAIEAFAELHTLGIAVGGVLTGPGRALLAANRAAIEGALAAVLPAQVDTLVMQADLTAIVPGLPTAELAALMRQVARPESTGAASVYRFTADGIRAALDSGRSAADLIGALSRRGAVPQPLTYLIDDVARRHAALRIGAAATYLRCDDPVTLGTILADPAASGLGMFRLAETVLASDQPPEHVLDQLRRLGHWPQPEAGRGPEAPAPRRARTRAVPVEPSASPVTPALAAAAIRAMRASDRPSEDPDGGGGNAHESSRGVHPVPSASQAVVMAALRSAIEADAAVWIGYSDPTGVAGDRKVEPLRLSRGYLTALDLRSQAIASFALARITGVQPA